MHHVSVACCRDGLDCRHGCSHDSSLACLHDMAGILRINDLRELHDFSASEDDVGCHGSC